MGLQFNEATRNALLDAIEDEAGTAPILRIYEGAKPAATTDAATGDLLAEMTLPSDFMAAASGGTKAKAGTWQDLTAADTGVAGYWRLYDTTDTTCLWQGECTDTAGAGPLKLSTTTITSGEPVTVVSWTFTAPNA